MCLSPQVPQVPTKTVASIKVNIQSGDEIKSKATKILTKPPAFIYLVHTDRPIYRPGQTGRRTRHAANVGRCFLCRSYFRCGCCMLDMFFLLIQPTLSILRCLLIRLHWHKFCLHQSVCIMLSHNIENFRKDVFIHQPDEQGFLKSSW